MLLIERDELNKYGGKIWLFGQLQEFLRQLMLRVLSLNKFGDVKESSNAGKS